MNLSIRILPSLAFSLALVLLSGPIAQAQQVTAEAVHVCALEAEFVNHHTRVDAPRLSWDQARRGATATFVPIYTDDVPVDQRLPMAARPAFEAALDIWSTHIASAVPIEVRVRWVALQQENVLASAGPRLLANFAAALDPNTWYATALASALQGQNLNADLPDIEVTVNAAFPRWYFGTDGNVPDDHFDFLTVILHEIGHGLGFVGSMQITNTQGRWGISPTGSQAIYPVVFDRYAEADTPAPETPLLDTSVFPNPSTTLAQALTSEQVYFEGPVTVPANIESQLQQGLAVPAGGRAKLHAPQEWNAGSSYNHLTELRVNNQEIYYPPGSLNSLMTPRIGATEVILTPGATTCGMLRDIGWPMGPSCEEFIPPPPPLLDEPLLVVGPCPNPSVGGRTHIQVHVPEQQRVRGDLYDVLGRRVGRILDRSVRASGPVTIGDEPRCTPGAIGGVDLNLSYLANGLYFLRVFTGDASQTVRITVVR